LNAARAASKLALAASSAVWGGGVEVSAGIG